MIFCKNGIKFKFELEPDAVAYVTKKVVVDIIKQNFEHLTDSFMQQLNEEVGVIGRVEKVKEVDIRIWSGYITSDKKDINIDFFIEYIIKRTKDRLFGFVSNPTIGRYSLEQEKFYEISDNMLSRIQIIS